MLTAVILVALGYVLIFVVLWSQTRFAARRPEVRIVVTPYGKHLHLAAPSPLAAVDAFLRADLELAKEGK